MKRDEVVAMRVRVLKQMNNLHKNNDVRPVVYLDETWEDKNHTRKKICQSKEGLNVPTGKRGRITLFYSSSSSFGFVNNLKYVFRCKSGPSEDYRSQMNYVAFKDWFIKDSTIWKSHVSFSWTWHLTFLLLLTTIQRVMKKNFMYKNGYKKREFSFHPWKRYRSYVRESSSLRHKN